MKSKNYNLDWSKYFEIDENSESGIVWKIPRHFNGTPNFDRVGKRAGSISKGKKNSYWSVGLGSGIGSFLVHRIIWVILNGEVDSGKDIDHIDGNGLNNKHSNLREVEKSINSRNKRLRDDNKSGVNCIHYIPCPLENPKNISDRWGAQFSPIKGKILTKSFSIRKYGNDKARSLAENWLELMRNKYKSSYSDRHGEKHEI